MAQEMKPQGAQRLTLRVGHQSMAFAMPQDGSASGLDFEPYVVKSGMSMAANLRQALRQATLPSRGAERVRVMVDSPVLMTPVELFRQDDMADLHHHAFPTRGQDTLLYNVMPDLNAVAVFSINKDLKMVLDDHFARVDVIAAPTPVWRHLHQRSYTGVRHKLYGYFHEGQLDVLNFQQNRFRFCNSFSTKHAHDALYFLLYVWRQLALKNEFDEMHIVGDIPEEQWLVDALHRYLQKVYVINPVADFNRAPATEIKGMPYDMMTLFVKGR